MTNQNQLVRLTTQDVSKAIPITTSIIIAEKIDYPHFQITRLIEKHIDDFLEFGTIDFESHLLNSKSVKSYLLNENQFILLVTYLRTSKKNIKVMDLKKEVVRQFSFMKKELLARSQTRFITKNTRLSLTESIQNNLHEGNFKSYAYSNYTRLIYKKMFGKSVKEIKEHFKLTEKDNLRDYLTISELEQLQKIESDIATIIQYEKSEDEKEVYEKVKKYLNDLFVKK